MSPASLLGWICWLRWICWSHLTCGSRNCGHSGCAIWRGLRIARDVKFAIPPLSQKASQKILAYRQCRDAVEAGKLLEGIDILFSSQQFFTERDAALAQQTARLITRLAAASPNVQSDRKILLRAARFVR